MTKTINLKLEQILIHIPHSSLNLPSYFFKYTLKDSEYIDNFNNYICDKEVPKLVPNKFNKLIFNYSRIFCDVERFRDDNEEIMSEKGMGVCYICDSKNNKFIDYDNNYKNNILTNIYDLHHNNLDNITTDILNKSNKCYIIDLHSFSDSLVKDLFNITDNPDICLGYEEDYIDLDLLEYTKEFFSEKGYTVKYNYPYKGTIIPNKYYKTNDNRVKSLMIEINKRVYLNNNFDKFKNIMYEYFNLIIDN